MNERIKEIRKSLGMTQSTFASKIGLSRNYIAQLEIGTRIPPDRTISDICREFSINEQWLRTGEGDMLLPVEDETAAVVASLLDEENPLFDLIVKVVREYNKLDEKSRQVMDKFIDDLLDEQTEKEKAD